MNIILEAEGYEESDQINHSLVMYGASASQKCDDLVQCSVNIVENLVEDGLDVPELEEDICFEYETKPAELHVSSLIDQWPYLQEMDRRHSECNHSL